MAEGPNVGYSTLSVIPTLRGVRQELENQLEDPLQRSAARAGAQASDALQSAFASTELVQDPDRLFAGVDSAAARAGSEAASELESASSEFRAAGERLSDAASSSFDLSPAAAEAAGELSRRLDAERGAVGSAGEQLGRAAGDGVEEGLRQTDVSGVGRQVGADAGAGIGGGVLDGIGDLSGGVEGLLGGALEGLPAALSGPALAAGAAAGALLIAGVGQGIENGRIESSFEAALGVTEDTAARYGDIAGRVFSANWGESLGQVSEAIKLVGQNFAGVGDLSEAELEQVSQGALQVANIFDQDLRQSVNATAQLIRTGLVRDADEAFDLITKGLQGPANKADDLLDTFNEYSTQFRDLGLTGRDALGLINQGVQAGARDADIAADALKEFAIRAKDGSETTAEGFALIGLNAEEMGDRVAAGGDSARRALAQTLDGLREIEDPALRSQAAVALFGTQAEDLGDALFALDLDTAAQELGDIDGAAQDAADSFDDIGSAIDELKRSVQTELGQFFEDALGPIAVGLSDNADWERLGVAIAQNIERGLDLVSPVEIIGGWLDRGLNLFGFGGDPEQDAQNLGEEIGQALVEGAVAGVSTAGEAVQTAIGDIVIAADVAGAVESLDELNAELEKSAGLADIADQRIQNFLSRIADSTSLDDAISSQLALRDATEQLVDGLGALQGVDIEGFAEGTVQVSDEAAEALGDVAGAASAAQQQIANTLEFQGEAAAIAKADELRAGFVELFQAAGLSKDQIDDLITAIGLQDWQIDAAVTLSGVDQAIAEIQLLRDLIDEDFPPEVEQQIVIALNEGRAQDARNLAGIYAEDIQDDLITNPLLLQLGVADPDDVVAQLQELFTDPSIPDEIVAQAAIAVDEGRLADAQNILEIWKQDRQDGLITNPLLVALGLGDTAPASGEVDAFIAGEEAKPPIDVNVSANTSLGLAVINQFIAEIARLRPTLNIATRVVNASGQIAMDGVAAAERSLNRDLNGKGIIGRALGGPITAGDLYMVGENEPELFMSDRAGRILNQQQIRDELPGAGGAAAPVYNIDVSGVDQPRQTAAEIARAMRRKEYLVGAAR